MGDESRINKVLDEMGKAWEVMQRKFEDAEQNAISKEEFEKVNQAITELRNEQTELTKALQRARAAKSAQDAWDNDDSPETQTLKRAFEKFIRYGNGEKSTGMMTEDERRALSDASDADGGFFAPAGMESGIIMAAYNLAALRPICNVGNTGFSQVMISKMSKPVFGWGQSGVAASERDINAGLETMTVNELVGLYLIANNTLEDADANVIGELTAAFGLGIAEEEDNQFATGDGVQKPMGLFSDSGVQANYTASGVAAALYDASNPLYDTLVDVLQALKTTYRRNSTWAMNSTVEGEVRKMKDTQNHPIWQMPVSADRPATLLGRPIVNPENAPAVAAGAFPIAIGDFSHYRIRDRRGLTIQRLVERYAEKRQTGFLVTKRLGAQVTQAEAFRLVKVGTS